MVGVVEFVEREELTLLRHETLHTAVSKPENHAWSRKRHVGRFKRASQHLQQLLTPTRDDLSNRTAENMGVA